MLRKRGFFSHLKWLLLIEALVLIYVFFHNLVGMRRRQLTQLMGREKELRERIALLKMEKARLTSLPELESYAKRAGLLPVKPEEVEALVREGGRWRWRKNVEGSR